GGLTAGKASRSRLTAPFAASSWTWKKWKERTRLGTHRKLEQACRPCYASPSPGDKFEERFSSSYRPASPCRLRSGPRFSGGQPGTRGVPVRAWRPDNVNQRRHVRAAFPAALRRRPPG